MSDIQTESPYYIFINGGDKMYVLGKTGRHETDLSEAITFTETYDAIVYIEKHGYQRIATIRKVKKRIYIRNIAFEKRMWHNTVEFNYTSWHI